MSDVTRFVSASSGVDDPDRGTEDAPLRTIGEAVKQLRAELSGSAQGSIRIQPGLYEEVLALTSNIELVADVFEPLVVEDVNDERVELKRPSAASAQGHKSTNEPTFEHVVKIRGSNIRMEGIRVNGDKRPQRGVVILDSTNVELSDCTVIGCHAKVWHHGSEKGTRSDPYRSKVRRRGTGAGVRVEKSTNVRFLNCSFVDNRNELKFRQLLLDSELDRLSAKTKLGAKLLGVDLRRPDPLRNGGGHVSVVKSSDVVFDNCDFAFGFCGGRGGAVQLGEKGYAKFTHCEFFKNSSGIDGGAVAVNDPSVGDFSRKTIHFTQCKFEKNEAGDDGGGVYVTSKGRVQLNFCDFEKNRAPANGGGLRVTFGSEVVVDACVFFGNEANTDAATKATKNHDGGGAIAVANANLFLRKSVINDNHCHGFAGGGLYFITRQYEPKAEEGAKEIHGHTFEELLKGAGKYNFNAATLDIKDCVFETNNTKGVTCYSDQCDIGAGDGMKAGGAGGAIYALESLKDFGIPIFVKISGGSFNQNTSTHRDNDQKSEIVVRNVHSFELSGESMNKDAKNHFSYTLIDVGSVDTSGSAAFEAAESAGLVVVK